MYFYDVFSRVFSKKCLAQHTFVTYSHKCFANKCLAQHVFISIFECFCDEIVCIVSMQFLFIVCLCLNAYITCNSLFMLQFYTPKCNII